MIVFAMIVAMITAPAGASDDGQDTFAYKTGNATVNVSGLNLRSGPGTDFAALASIGKSQAVKILGQLGEWYAVYDYNSKQVGFDKGIISRPFLRIPKMILRFRMKRLPAYRKMSPIWKT